MPSVNLSAILSFPRNRAIDCKATTRFSFVLNKLRNVLARSSFEHPSQSWLQIASSWLWLLVELTPLDGTYFDSR